MAALKEKKKTSSGEKGKTTAVQETAAAKEEKLPGIEESLDRIDTLLEEMGSDECTLEKSFSLYEEGMKLIAHADAEIARVEQRLRVLSDEETDDAE